MKKITPRYYHLHVDKDHPLEDSLIDLTTQILTTQLRENTGGLVDLMHALIYTTLLANARAARHQVNPNTLATIAVTGEIFKAAGFTLDLTGFATRPPQQDHL